MKLGEYAREWLDSKHKLKPSTRARYQVVLDTVIAAHAEIAVGDISRQLVREWVTDLSVYLAPASVHKTIGVLRQILAMAVAENRLSINPVDGVELPPVTAAEQRFLTLEQLRALVDAAGEHRPLVYVRGTCGLRFGEVAELRWRDLNLETNHFRISRSVTLVDGSSSWGRPRMARAAREPAGVRHAPIDTGGARRAGVP